MNDANVLSPVAQRFVLHWGEMGTRWGVNRTVAQIHALLFISPHPLPADEIAATLGVARSNVSTGLRELQNWSIVRVVHLVGDRRDHFESLKDVYEMFRLILRERRRREIDPTTRVLRECIAETAGTGTNEKYTRERLHDLLGFFELATATFDKMEKLPTPALLKAARMGDRALKALGLTGR